MTERSNVIVVPPPPPPLFMLAACIFTATHIWWTHLTVTTVSNRLVFVATRNMHHYAFYANIIMYKFVSVININCLHISNKLFIHSLSSSWSFHTIIWVKKLKEQGNSVARDLPPTGSEAINTTIVVFLYILDIDSHCPYIYYCFSKQKNILFFIPRIIFSRDVGNSIKCKKNITPPPPNHPHIWYVWDQKSEQGNRGLYWIHRFPQSLSTIWRNHLTFIH